MNIHSRICFNECTKSARVGSWAMELTLHCEKQGSLDVGENVRGALFVVGENDGHIKQARLSEATIQKSLSKRTPIV